ncbi:hypothetical protein GZ78_29105 [Endozoicomonas numazuensis]|uniref:Peptidase C58 YopT-type domain-containing protein n=1 Tax=Endozoicomonas numazuensis TaxID=1137799 RepID=A0A081MYS5_9GAMM|nr:hypothetical protein GZ78_29105 [Endozoicomonas numazuensis]
MKKYISTSTDSSINYKELEKRAFSVLTKQHTSIIKVPDNCCLGVSVEWIENFLEPASGSFNYQRARLLHHEYWSGIESTERRDTLNNKKKKCVDLTYEFLSRKMNGKGINIDVEPHSFKHIKSMLAPLSQAFFLLPKCSTLLILQGLGKNREFQGHNFVISWSLQNENEYIIFLDPAGTQATWKKYKRETYSRFFIRVMDDISDIVGCSIKGDSYSHEEIKSVLLYKGTSLKDITDVD